MKNRGRELFAGALTLTVAGFLVKVIGLVYKIPLTNILGDSGMGYFTSAYTVYTVFYTVLASGLPIALSLIISEARALGSARLEYLAFRRSMALFTLLGAAASLIMVLLAGPFAYLIGNSGAAVSVAFIAPTLFFVSGVGVMRGYFQGRGDMIPTSVSQIIEAAGKLLIGLLLLLLARRLGLSLRLCSAFAILGISLSTAAAFFYLFIKKGRVRELSFIEEKSGDKDTVDISFKRILSVSMPITLSALAMSLSGVIDLLSVTRLLGANGISEDSANALFGNYSSLALPVFNMPSVLITPIVYSFSPLIRECALVGDRENTVKNIDKALESAIFISLVISFGMAAFPREILSLIFSGAESVKTAAPALRILAMSVVFFALFSVISGIHQALGRSRIPIIAVCIGSLIKVILSVTLIPRVGIIGAAIGTAVCYFTAALISSLTLAHTVSYALPIRIVLKPLCASCIAIIAAVSLRSKMSALDPRLATLVAISVCAVIYFALYLAAELALVKKKTRRKK